MSSRRGRPFLVAFAIAMLAVNLRPALAGFAPLVDEVQSALGLSAITASLVTTLPLICFGVSQSPRLRSPAGTARNVSSSS